MTTLTLPTPPELAGVPNDRAVGKLGDWLMRVARKCGGPAVEHALGEGWPASAELRGFMPSHLIEMARNEAHQLANETWAKERKAKGTWGV
jgi:hypothetical protein